MRRTLHTLVALAALVLAGPACKGRPTSPHAPDRLTVGVAVLRISLPVFVAQQQGFFRRHGLDVTLRPYETAQPMLEEVLDGRTDAGGFVAYPIVFMASRNAAHPPRVATSLVEDGAHRLSWVLARRGSGLHFPADARGKNIGILPTVAYRKWLEALLQAGGIQPGEVTITPVAPPMQAQVLASGGVDMLFTNDPMASAMLVANAAEVIDDGPPCARHLHDPFTFGTFAISERLATTRPEVASRLVAAIDDGIAYVMSHQAEARRAMRPFLRPEQQGAVDHYPEARYLTSREATPALFQAEVERETTMGILQQPTRVTVFTAVAAR
jgi:NitT/TauT family transport system substrate-binding protein